MPDFTLSPHPDFEGVRSPLVLVILDGVGLYRGVAEGYEGNAFDKAHTPVLDSLLKSRLSKKLKAHGTAVGMPSDGDMGNSEIGHNALGAGRIFDQGAKLVQKAIESGSLFEGNTWKEQIDRVKTRNSALHFIGLLSDGNVHSHIDHLLAMISQADREGVETLYIHPLMDGRDVDETSAHLYLGQLENHLETFRAKGRAYHVASGGGRMGVTMDRYEADWSIVERGWNTHVKGEGRRFASAMEALQTLRNENPGIIDQDLPPFVVEGPDGGPIGPIVDGDAVIFFNFRGDRAIEISRAFTEEEFDAFPRGPLPDVAYAGMMEYDGDRHIPPRFLQEPPQIDRTISEYLVHNGKRQFAISETQKFGHVTYFWNGNNSEKFDPKLEDWMEIESDRIRFDKKPEMKAIEITREVITSLSRGYDFIRVNFANGDMVGHTGSLDAAVIAMETVDRCLGELLDAVKVAGGTAIVTADHGNCDMMWEVNKKTGEVKTDAEGRPASKTSHTLNPVPWVLVTPDDGRIHLREDLDIPGLSNVAATLLNLLGFEAPKDYRPGLLAFDRKSE